jgi:hypothetical protein
LRLRLLGSVFSWSSAVSSCDAMTRSPIALYKSCFAEAKSASVGDRAPPSFDSAKGERSAASTRVVNRAMAVNSSFYLAQTIIGGWECDT